MIRLRRRSDIALTALDGGTFLVDARNDAIFHLDALGGGVWSALAEPMTREDLVALLADAFPDTPPDTITHDVDALLAEFTARDLLDEV
ncbi:MAG TPA: PqqD family protein [Vineibacter sp.]|nr:PqqD family protein [Vineibacter sp.]